MANVQKGKYVLGKKNGGLDFCQIFAKPVFCHSDLESYGQWTVTVYIQKLVTCYMMHTNKKFLLTVTYILYMKLLY